jgi:hypothetical protein
MLALLCAPLRGQVGTLATAPPVLSPVGLWRTAANEPGPGALANTLTIRINSGATPTIAALLDNAINAFPVPVSITTEWDLTALISAVDLVAYFAAPTTALSTTGASIPSSRVEGRMVTGRATSFAPFTGGAIAGVGTPGASLHLFRQWVIAPFNGVGRRTDNLDLRLNLAGLAPLPAGTYRGTLTLRAIAQ